VRGWAGLVWLTFCGGHWKCFGGLLAVWLVLAVD